MSRWAHRPAQVADGPLLRSWLPAGVDMHSADEGQETWLLALADQIPLACLRVRVGIGLRRPRHWYHVGCTVHAAPELGLFNRQTTLLLCNDHTGAAELADFAHDPGLSLADQAAALRTLLQAARQHLDHQAAPRGSPVIIELPGLRDGQGRSPFWQSLGRYFFDGDLAEVVRQHGSAWRAHVASLLPRQPLYTAFLAEPARAAIAQTAPSARAWMDVLAHDGFRYSHHVTIIDGGPVFVGHLGGE